jgi:hypothetical protein
MAHSAPALSVVQSHPQPLPLRLNRTQESMRYALLLLMGLLGMSSQAAEVVDLSKKDLGIHWGATLEELKTRFPGMKTLGPPNRFIFRGPVVVGPIVEDGGVVLLTLDGSGGLVQVGVSAGSARSLELAEAIYKAVPGGRSASYPNGKSFVHMFEWTTSSYSIQLRYVRMTATPFDAPVLDGVDSMLYVSRDRPQLSWVDDALARPNAVEYTRPQMLEGFQRRQDRGAPR